MNFFTIFGQYIIFMKSMFSKPERLKIYLKRILFEMNVIGVGSLPIVAIIATFIGAVTTIQTAFQLVSSWISRTVIGAIVSDSTMLELGPTITCLVLAGKVGSNIAGEIGTMKVTEQVDALEVMGINSSGYIALPKIVAGLIMVPCLIIVADFLSIYGGLLAGELSGILTAEQYIEGARSSFKLFTLEVSLIKAITFAFLITSVSSFMGYNTKGGALEVGESSTKAVVYSCVLILVFDYLIAQILL